MSRARDAQIKNELKAAKGDLRFWTGKSRSATDPVTAATYRRGVDQARARIDKAEQQLKGK